jgi:hypothetical protein
VGCTEVACVSFQRLHLRMSNIGTIVFVPSASALHATLLSQTLMRASLLPSLLPRLSSAGRPLALTLAFADSTAQRGRLKTLHHGSLSWTANDTAYLRRAGVMLLAILRKRRPNLKCQWPDRRAGRVDPAEDERTVNLGLVEQKCSWSHMSRPRLMPNDEKVGFYVLETWGC